MSFRGFWSDIKDNKTLWVQIPIAFCSLCVAVAAIAFAVATLREERNAALVRIGVSILRADPTKEPTAGPARRWALDLIDANSGGVKFSSEARAALLEQALPLTDTSWYIGGSDTSYSFKGGDNSISLSKDTGGKPKQ